MSTLLEPSRPFHIGRTLHDTFVPALADLVQYPRQSIVTALRRRKSGETVSLETKDFLEWHWKWKHGNLFGKRKSRGTICIAESIDQISKITGAICEGEDAQRFWEEDFQKLSCFREPGAQPFDIKPGIQRLNMNFRHDIYISYLSAAVSPDSVVQNLKFQHANSPREDHFNWEAHPEHARPPNQYQSGSGPEHANNTSNGSHRQGPTMLDGSSEITITGGQLNNIQGNQVNHFGTIETHSTGLYILGIAQSVQLIQFNFDRKALLKILEKASLNQLSTPALTPHPDRNSLLKILEKFGTFSLNQLSTLASSFDRSAINVLLFLVAYRTFQPQISQLIGPTHERQLIQ